jgi:hypothetical protein
MHACILCLLLQDDEDDETAIQPGPHNETEVKAEATTESSSNGGSSNGASCSSSNSNGDSSSSANTGSSSSSSSSSGKQPAAAPRRATPPSLTLAVALQEAKEGASNAGVKGTVEDFQAGLLQWDILAELRAEVTDTRRAYEAAHRDEFSDITVPDHFASFAEYLSVWKPLCLREARAQTLNSLISDAPTDDPAEVRLRTSAIPDNGGDLFCMDMLVIEDRGSSSGGGGSSSGGTAARRALRDLRGGELLLFTRDKDTLPKLLALPRGGASPVAAYSAGTNGIVSGCFNHCSACSFSACYCHACMHLMTAVHANRKLIESLCSQQV